MSDSIHQITFPGESETYRAARNKLLRAELELRTKIEEVAKLRQGLPALTMKYPDPTGPPNTGQPQVWQKTLRTWLPLPPVYSNVVVSPLTATLFLGTIIMAMWPAPLNFWQSVHWQITYAFGSALTS